MRDAEIVPTDALAGVIAYEPAELVLTVGAGTPLAEIEALLAANGQMLAFDPFDHGALLGGEPGAATIGGVVAAGVSGSRRLSAGAARDHLLGFRAVSGRGELFVAGGKVVKNVTGYDVSKLMAGCWGRLALLVELSLKVLPAPRERASLVLEGLSDRAAIAAMARAMGGPFEVAAAAHFPRASGRAATVLRVEGFGPSVDARLADLADALGGDAVRGDEECALWAVPRMLEPLAGGALLWRIVVPPSAGAEIVEGLGRAASRWLYDWAGGLVWLATDDPGAPVREVAERAGGHAMLVRAAPEIRARIPALHPEPPAVAALAQRIRRSFDPAGVFATARFGDDAHAH